jgi:Fanconi anemia group M protein
MYFNCRALGQQAYCTVVAALHKETQRFRVLALSATPGDNLEAVQEVLSNLVRITVAVMSMQYV